MCCEKGLVLGSLLFIVYCLPLPKLIGNYSVSHHVYVDDIQLHFERDKMIHYLHMILYVPVSIISKSGYLPITCG